MSIKDISTPCSSCSGTGIEKTTKLVDGEPIEEEITCRACGGSKVSSLLNLSDDLISLLQDMNDKINDIFEKVNE